MIFLADGKLMLWSITFPSWVFGYIYLDDIALQLEWSGGPWSITFPNHHDEQCMPVIHNEYQNIASLSLFAYRFNRYAGAIIFLNIRVFEREIEMGND